MITNSRVDTRVDVSEQTNGQTNIRKLAHLYGAAEADATKTNYFLLCPKTVGGVEGTRYLLPIHFCSIRAQKMSTLKMRKK